MSHIKIKWDGDEAKVTFTGDFKVLYDIARLDCLKDAIWELQNAYSAEIDAFHKHATNNRTEKAE